MAAVDEVLSAVSFHRSKLCLSDDGMAQKIANQQKSFQKAQVVSLALSSSVMSPSMAGAFFDLRDLPLPPTNATTEVVPCMRKLHQALSLYWCELVAAMQLTLQPGYQQSVDADLQLLEREVNGLIEAKMQAEDAKAQDEQKRLGSLKQFAVSLIATKSTSAAYRRSPKKPKVKTRSDKATRSTETVLPSAVDSEAPQEGETSGDIAVRSSSLQLFERMFSRFDESQGTIAWDDFVGRCIRRDPERQEGFRGTSPASGLKSQAYHAKRDRQALAEVVSVGPRDLCAEGQGG
ncbi:uncharacterized protein LTR77_006999 [Saxophila tyrrhenica]|uniref:Uncharacterized protein n=1 Tax=Saxophila tyrrhenica TaxID=1690608 RepID=A0AAV9P765_9PEZI|nr:hypothetical protein LTR77_006999 [Saxophila tyrrhenica]